MGTGKINGVRVGSDSATGIRTVAGHEAEQWRKAGTLHASMEVFGYRVRRPGYHLFQCIPDSFEKHHAQAPLEW